MQRHSSSLVGAGFYLSVVTLLASGCSTASPPPSRTASAASPTTAPSLVPTATDSSTSQVLSSEATRPTASLEPTVTPRPRRTNITPPNSPRQFAERTTSRERPPQAARPSVDSPHVDPEPTSSVVDSASAEPKATSTVTDQSSPAGDVEPTANEHPSIRDTSANRRDIIVEPIGPRMGKPHVRASKIPLGEVEIGSRGPATIVRFTNRLDNAVTILDVTVDANFRVTSNRCTRARIEVDQECSFGVFFAPAASGLFTTDLTLRLKHDCTSRKYYPATGTSPVIDTKTSR